MAENKTRNKIKSTSNQNANDFLLAEFTALQGRAISLEEIKSSKVNFYLIVFAAFVAGLSGLADVQGIREIYPIIVSLGAMTLLLLGFSTLKNAVDYSVAAVSLLRRAARIRRWFIDNNSDIQPYVAFQANDDRPRMFIGKSLLPWRGGEPILIIANIVTASLFIGICLSYISIVWSIVGVSFSIFIVWQLQIFYLKRKLTRLEISEKSKVNFSSEPETEDEKG